jgi:hypothetical protein
MVVCAAYGAENTEVARFCNHCGAALSAQTLLGAAG